jgi:hypothetical protein
VGFHLHSPTLFDSGFAFTEKLGPKFCTAILTYAPKVAWGMTFETSNESSPLLGGAEAEGFGVGS